jgi:hypothetical protein
VKISPASTQPTLWAPVYLSWCAKVRRGPQPENRHCGEVSLRVSPCSPKASRIHAGYLVLCSRFSLAVSKLLEQTGHPGAGEPLTDVHSSVQPEGGSHHTSAPGQDTPAPEACCVSALLSRGQPFSGQVVGRGVLGQKNGDWCSCYHSSSFLSVVCCFTFFCPRF